MSENTRDDFSNDADATIKLPDSSASQDRRRDRADSSLESRASNAPEGARQTGGRGTGSAEAVVQEEVVEYEELPGGLLGALDARRGVKGAIAALLVVVALLSAIPLGNHFSQPESYAKTIEALDNQKATVTGLVAVSTAASAGISALPGDAGTPIAEKLADLSTDFLIILTAIFLEKFLLTTFGFAAFRILVPAACLLVIAALLIKRRVSVRARMSYLAAKLALLAAALVLVVPASVAISSGMIETHNATINTSLDTQVPAAAAQAESEATTQDEKPLHERLLDMATSIPETVTGKVDESIEWAQSTLNSLMEDFALLVVTSCIMPILVLVFFLWIAKLILGVNVEAPMRMLRPRALGAKLR